MVNLKLDELNGQSGSVEITIPLRITIRLGQPELTTTLLEAGLVGQTPVAGVGGLAEAAADPASIAIARVAQAKWVGLTNSNFTWTNALAMAACSHLAYSEPSAIRQVCQSQWEASELLIWDRLVKS